jgi:lipopolysaccharide biosynthesis glycosyltransferase
MGVIHLACAAERNYLAHSAAMLVSALRNRGTEELEIHYLHGPRFPRRGRRRLTEMVEGLGGSISFVEIPDSAVAGLPTKGFTRKATWYRIFLPDLLPAVDRVLYLDVDTIVTSDLGALWKVDLRGQYVGAVTNVFQADHVQRTAKLGIKPRDYFNAGVLLFNLDLMRVDRCSESLRRIASEHPSGVAWRDQDALNLVLGSRRLPLHPRWNCMNSILQFPVSFEVFGTQAVEEARRNPGIRHFEGPGLNKPWHEDSPAADRDLYLEHRRQTPWPRMVLEGSRPKDRLGRALDRIRPHLLRIRRLVRARQRLRRIRRRLRRPP